MNIKEKHWRGHITIDSIANCEMFRPDAFTGIWQKIAQEVEAKGNTLVVFEIPAANEKELIGKLEQFLQDQQPDQDTVDQRNADALDALKTIKTAAEKFFNPDENRLGKDS